MVSVKKVTNADTGTADIVGGDDWDTASDLINANHKPVTYLIRKVGSNYSAVSGDNTGELTSGPNAKTVIQAAIDAVPSDGGTIKLAPNTTFDLGSDSANALTILNNKPKRVNFLGSGVTSVLLFTGVGQAIEVINNVDTSSHINYEIGNFMISGVSSPFTSASSVITSGCNGIKIDHTYGTYDLHHIFFRNLDVGIWSDSTEFSSIHHIVGLEFNTGIKVTGDSGHNTLSGLHITDFKLSGGHDVNGAGIYYNASQFNVESCYIGRGVINVMPYCIRIDGFTTNPTLEDIYFEATLPAAEATYGGETLALVYLKGESAKPIEQAYLKQMRMGGVENMDNGIILEYATMVTLEDCVAKGFRNAMVLINSNSAGGVTVDIKNPRLRAYPNFTNVTTPWLIDVPSNAFLTTTGAKLAGSVQESGRTGIITNISSTGLVEGDVVILTGADATMATTTTADSANPSAIMYPNAGANRPGVIASSGRTKVLTDAATTLGDTLTTSTTTKKAKTNNSMTDPKFIIGYAVEAIGATGLCWTRLGR